MTNVYKSLIKISSSREDLSLPRNVYYILDEFGNMPKIEKFDKMITVGRSRKIWFNMVVQSYAQLNNVYGDTIADIVKGNCGIKMFIGSNDMSTCKEFSELCGNITVVTQGSSSSGKDNTTYSQNIQTRPLIYPSELQKLNNKTSTGNSIVVTFGNHPLKTNFTPSYKVNMYTIGAMSLEDTEGRYFDENEVYYDITVRNTYILGSKTE
jgi:type IV secretion system protein VirD4